MARYDTLQSRMLLLQIGSLLAATVAIFTWYDRYYNNHPRLALVIVTCSILYILCFGTVPQAWRLYRQKRRDALSLPDYTEIPRKYFRLDPYVAATANEFRRDDNAHVEVLEWIRDSTHPVLYLSGVSGCGKSSILEGYVLPKLIEDGWRTQLVRTFSDPLPPLEAALNTPRRRGTHLLIVCDQFEEFAILQDRTPAAERERFVDRVRELQLSPPPGVILLFSFRRDYMNDVVVMKIGELVPNHTFYEIDAFKRGAARKFLEKALDKEPGAELVDRLLAGAEALDDVPARFRPITLNMLGLALQDLDLQVTAKPEKLVQDYMQRAVAQSEIKEIAPAVIGEMISDANTKEPRTVGELASLLNLNNHDVLVCLTLLAQKGLVRKLDAPQELWEISHDFVARQLAILLGRLRPSPWPRLAMLSAPILLILILSGLIIWLPGYAEERAYSNLRGMEIAVTIDGPNNLLIATFSPISDDRTYASALPDLNEVRISDLDLSHSNVTTLPTLPSSLHALNVSGSKITTLPALPSTLQTLNISGSEIATLPALPSTLQTLNASGSRITTLPALPTRLKELNISGSSITTLPELPSSLHALNVSGYGMETGLLRGSRSIITTLPALPSTLQTLNACWFQDNDPACAADPSEGAVHSGLQHNDAACATELSEDAEHFWL